MESLMVRAYTDGRMEHHTTEIFEMVGGTEKVFGLLMTLLNQICMMDSTKMIQNQEKEDLHGPMDLCI